MKTEIIQSGLEFIQEKLEPMEDITKLLVIHSHVPFCTVYDEHIEGLTQDLAGACCHFFIDRIGNVYQGRELTHAVEEVNGTIVICLEGNLNADNIIPVQEETLVTLTNELKKEHGISDVVADKINTGTNFPVNEFLEATGSKVEVETKDVVQGEE